MMSTKNEPSALVLPEPEPDDAGADEVCRIGRDAQATRRALVRAARRRFATDGYRATTVRGIAADAGVNVALISRYFGSKEGLFAACMQRSVDELNPLAEPQPENVDEMVEVLLSHASRYPDADEPLQLLLLLRSSGDESADRIRRETLESFTERLAVLAGWRPLDPATEHIRLRAQIALATMLGLIVLRTSAKVEPITSATAAELAQPLRQVLLTLLNENFGKESSPPAGA